MDPTIASLWTRCPGFFSATSDKQSTSSSYYGLTGNGAFFDGAAGTSMNQVTDGTSNTILVVEAKREIPWTKPEDIAYDATKPLPKFGGFFPEGFNIALCDGSVRFVVNQVGEQVLRALITKSGGEVIPQF